MSVSIDSVSDIYVQNLDMTNILILNAICCQIYIPYPNGSIMYTSSHIYK